MRRRFVNMERPEIQPLSGLALPTIFLILIFFLVMLTNIRNDKMKVGKVEAPQATELSVAMKHAIVTTIYIGKTGGRSAVRYRIQLNNQVMTLAKVEAFIKKSRMALKPDERPLMTVMLKVDKDTPMGIVSDVKQALRRANVLNIIYSARPE
ncbi:ExbD/TolR family protein [Bacteroides sedimenti]|uniref:Biopolymer transporter ExbD n=1 Tax=Bacteroides sedimenti TaxID=2136147 RepID=A0ABN6Z7H8_9BACE